MINICTNRELCVGPFSVMIGIVLIECIVSRKRMIFCWLCVCVCGREEDAVLAWAVTAKVQTRDNLIIKREHFRVLNIAITNPLARFKDQLSNFQSLMKVKAGWRIPFKINHKHWNIQIERKHSIPNEIADNSKWIRLFSFRFTYFWKKLPFIVMASAGAHCIGIYMKKSINSMDDVLLFLQQFNSTAFIVVWWHARYTNAAMKWNCWISGEWVPNPYPALRWKGNGIDTLLDESFKLSYSCQTKHQRDTVVLSSVIPIVNCEWHGTRQRLRQ